MRNSTRGRTGRRREILFDDTPLASLPHRNYAERIFHDRTMIIARIILINETLRSLALDSSLQPLDGKLRLIQFFDRAPRLFFQSHDRKHSVSLAADEKHEGGSGFKTARYLPLFPGEGGGKVARKETARQRISPANAVKANPPSPRVRVTA